MNEEKKKKRLTDQDITEKATVKVT